MAADIKLAEFLGDNERYADLFNGYMFQENPVILPEELESKEIRGALKTGKRKNQYRYFYRDILKKRYKGAVLMVLGIENQQEIHYVMPVRTLVYDGIAYKQQWEKIKKHHRKKKDLEGAEYLSGFSKEDKLLPVITIVVYYGKEPWDGARDLYGLFQEEAVSKEMEPFLNNYRINLLDVRHHSVECFKTDIKQCFQFLQNESDKEALGRLLNEDEAFCSLSEETFQLISVLSGESELLEKKRKYENKDKGGYNMCQAFADMRMEGRLEGRLEGIRAGREEGRLEGINEKGIQVFINAVNRGMTEEDAKAIAEIDDELVKEAKRRMGK